MNADHQRFSDATVARAYVRSLAHRFEDPKLILELMNASDCALAALLHMLVHEQLVHRCQQSDPTATMPMRRAAEKDEVMGDYHQAVDGFHCSIQRIAALLARLDIRDTSGCC